MQPHSAALGDLLRFFDVVGAWSGRPCAAPGRAQASVAAGAGQISELQARSANQPGCILIWILRFASAKSGPAYESRRKLMGKTLKPLLFIDTNIFLDFYRGESEVSLSLLKHVESIPEGLITTDQVEMEFLHNRQRVISAALQSLKIPSLPPFVPAYLADSRAASRIEKNLNDMKLQIGSLRKRLARILENPAAHDPVFKVVKKAFSFRSPMNLKFCDAKRDKILERALQRFHRGLPPRKRDDTSLGDAINWEWIVECASGFDVDVVVVSRDGDFGLRFDGKHYLNDWLQQEFRDRVSSKRKVEFTTSLVQALRILAVPVTKAEEDEERRIIAQQAAPATGPPLKVIWDQLLSRLGQKSAFTRSYLLEAVPVSLQDKRFTIGFYPEFVDQLELVNNRRTHDLLTSSLKDMGLEGVQVSLVLLPAAATPIAEPELSPQP
jgi:predicted nucleic acid-binding protein